MVTIHRAQGLRVVIFTNDHEPAHVHVFGDGEAKIDLGFDGDAPSLVWALGMSRAELRAAIRIVADNRAAFLVRWRDIHG